MSAVFVPLSGADTKGNTIQTAEMVYVSDSTNLYYLSCYAMEQLKIIAPDFPTVNATVSVSDFVTTSEVTSSDSHTSDPSKSTDHNPHQLDDTTKSESSCNCPRQQPPPSSAAILPFELIEENNNKIKQLLLNKFSASTFNRCPHQLLPIMTRLPISIHIYPATKPMAVHTPALIPVHWKEEVKQQLDADVALSMIKKVEPNATTKWCHCAIWVRKPDGIPRKVVDFQSLNHHCLWDTHHTVPPFQQAHAIPPNTYR